MPDELIEHYNLDKSQLDFHARINLPSLEFRPPVRVYCHIAGFVDGFHHKTKTPTENARDHLVEMIKNKNCTFLRNYNWVLAVAWGEQEKKMVDFLCYHNIGDDWPGNPSIAGFVTENETIVRPPGPLNINEFTCEDSIIVLAAEAKYRRTTNNLAEYASCPPSEIEGLVF